jgi:uncharacterized protein YbgA (DUF1722 family)
MPPNEAHARLRENFVERVFAYARLRDLLDSRWSVGALVAFHSAHKLTLMAHSPGAYRELGRMVASAADQPRAELATRYAEQFMAALQELATPQRHVNVLQHIAGYFKKTLDDASRRELQEAIEDYGRGVVPLTVPLTLVRQHVGTHDVTYLAGQIYLQPHPNESILRNHI